MRKIRFPPCLAACIALAAQGAAIPASAGDDAELGPVVVTATRIPTPLDEIASSMTVITAADIAASQLPTVSALLAIVPGLNVVQEGGPGGETSIFIRGTNSNHTKVLIDGIDVSDPSNSGAVFDFGQLLSRDIERIEVLRGPQSGLYGSDAIGGVINIITRTGAGPAQWSGMLEGGSFDTFNQEAGVRGSDDALSYAATVQHFHAGATPVTPLDLIPPGESRIDDYDDNLTTSTKLQYDLAPDLGFTLVGRYTDIHYRYTADNPDDFPSPPEGAQSIADTTSYATRIAAHASDFDGAFTEELGVAFSHDRTLTQDPIAGPAANTGDRVKVDWQGDVKLAPGETLVLGAEHARDVIAQPLSAGVIDNAGDVELQSQLGGQFYSAANVRYDDNQRFGSKATWRFAPAWLIPQSGTKLKASAGSGFKAPTLSELYQNFPPFFFSNPNLKPETSLGYDAGMEQELAPGLRAGATWFHNDISNLITTDVTGTTYANVGRATTQGVESFLAWQPAKDLKLQADYTFTEAEDDVLEEELLRRPKHKASLNGDWQVGRGVSLDATVLYVGTWVDGNRDFSIARLDAPGYVTVNLAAAWAFSAAWSLFARIDNLLDRRYQEPIGFEQPGLGVFAGVRMQL
ncbi:MAG TPA: TonB-dependent receptor [Steroidobacteraceae bacterium]|nr:TonB-dependent receptor [Steroidobacteraceae bacterium]